ncbi:MAG: DUF493 domain-containing protein, partial [Mariprofundaceae bacterium]|nr:DUF493 domain-containing protein [Mariprofundaceae bacterium]
LYIPPYKHVYSTRLPNMHDNNPPPTDTLMTFPCSFPFKVMGLNNPTFEQDMLHIVQQHIPQQQPHPCRSKPSKNGKYTALTITFTAQSKSQLDALYQEVYAHPDVKMVL